MDIVERFLNYTKFDTQSAEDSQTTPSTEKQWAFARYLKGELEDIGLDDVELDENGYLYAVLPANTNKKAPEIGFIAHMDTSPDCSGADINPRIVECYDGGDIVLDAEADIRISPQTFPELLSHKGEDIIVTDGHTLLGADDKAGIAEIVQAMVYLMEHPEIEHGNIHVAFNPDEEIGMGAHKFDVEKFGCEWAYTMDGSEVGELEFENFNAASAKIAITGMSVHPGYAKGKMLNAGRIAAELVAMMPEAETPEQTEGYEGFFHLTGMSGSVERAEVSYIIRDHDRKRFEDYEINVVTEKAPTAEEMENLKLAMTICKHVRSNAITVACDGRIAGVGAGQMNRVGAAHIALEEAKEKGLTANLCLASDAFFPFDDVVKMAKEYGVTAIIQPGGSVRDEDSIKACNEFGIAMVFTGVRHFRH